MTYLVKEELRKTTAGQCFLYFVASLFAIFFLRSLLFIDWNEKYHGMITKSLTVCFELAFLWINVLTFDIWWTFEKVKLFEAKRRFYHNLFHFQKVSTLGLHRKSGTIQVLLLFCSRFHGSVGGVQSRALLKLCGRLLRSCHDRFYCCRRRVHHPSWRSCFPEVTG